MRSTTPQNGLFNGIRSGAPFVNPRSGPSAWYGIQLNEANSSPDVTRIASDMALHAELPVHSGIKACLLTNDGRINYFLNAADWGLTESGSPSNLDGTDGQVMIRIPEYWRKAEYVRPGVIEISISPYPVLGFEYIPQYFIGAYESALQRTGTRLCSVKNLTTDYRGGNNNAAWDAGNNTLLGKPATLISLTNFRTYARNRGSNKWNVLPWRNVMLLYELYIIEHATLNSQKAVNANLTSKGYKQGGLGAGVTTVVSSDWTTFSGQYPIIPCGQSDSLASGSGEVAYSVPGFPGASGNVKIPRYRGIENIFGHIWEWQDGCSIFHEGAGGVSKFYTCDTPALFADNTANNYSYRSNLPAANGYVKRMTFDNKGIMIPVDSTGGAATYFCDYFYTPGLVNGWRASLRGGLAYDSANAGFVYLNTNHTASRTYATIGARLCYIP